MSNNRTEKRVFIKQDINNEKNWSYELKSILETMNLIDDYYKTVTFDMLHVQINTDLAYKFQKLSKLQNVLTIPTACYILMS